MNAAILLVSSAWMAGQTPEVIIPVNHNSGSCGTSCGASCGDCCNDSIGHRLRDRFQGLFQRDCCDSGCGHARQVRCHEPKCQDACDPCGRRFGNGELLGRLRGMFHRNDCCDPCCGNGTSAPGSAEPIKEQPKKMPSKKEQATSTGATVIVQPAQAPLPAIQNAPVIVPAPGLAPPRILENDSRNPF